MDEILKQYNEGHIKASVAYFNLRMIKSQVEDAIKDIENDLLDEIIMMGPEDLIVEGHKISHVPGRVTFDYKSSPTWNEYRDKLKKVEEKLKQATKLGVEIVDPDSGEVYEAVEKKEGKGYIKLEQQRG